RPSPTPRSRPSPPASSPPPRRRWGPGCGGDQPDATGGVDFPGAGDGFMAAFARRRAMEINGIAHLFVTAGDFEVSREFYRKLLSFLGLTPVLDTDNVFYCVGGRTGFAV